jgi:hypothetical protein
MTEEGKTVVNSWNEWDPLKHVIVGIADVKGERFKAIHTGTEIRLAGARTGGDDHPHRTA